MENPTTQIHLSLLPTGFHHQAIGHNEIHQVQLASQIFIIEKLMDLVFKDGCCLKEDHSKISMFDDYLLFKHF